MCVMFTASVLNSNNLSKREEMNARVKFRDSRSNRSQDIRDAHFVMDNNE